MPRRSPSAHPAAGTGATAQPKVEIKVDPTAVGRELQDTLVELTDLALRGKQAHWNLAGPHFTAVHEQLDQLIKTVRRGGDDVAERAVTVGFNPDGRPSTVAKSTPLHEFPAGQITVSEAVDLVSQALGSVCGHIRERIARLQERDLVSQELLIGLLATLEKHYWMFAVQRISDPGAA